MDLKIFTNKPKPSLDSEIMDFAKQHPKTKIRIMPDYHKGKGCVIGTTMDMSNEDRINPGVVGVDIGCGVTSHIMHGIKMTQEDIKAIGEAISESVPVGFETHKTTEFKFDISRIKAPLKDLNVTQDYVDRSMGTLGGGNHFIEVGYREVGNSYALSVHSGSRGLGFKIANYYMSKATDGYISGELMKDYLNDMAIVQKYATINREEILCSILERAADKGFVIDYLCEHIDSIHNYIDLESKILRKGAISAKKGEKLVIPMNMRDGILLCEGLGNDDWNQSAPHGAGRVLSRSQAKKTLDFDDFKREMEGIHSTTVTEKTIDESPMAYKEMYDIVDVIDGETVVVLGVYKTILSHKG